MKDQNIIQEKSFDFAIRVVNVCKFLKAEKKEFDMSKQLLRCGTSIGANVEEAIGAQSKADFIAKLSIAYKEARETTFWLRLLNATAYLSQSQFDSLIADCNEICKIMAKILITMKT